MSDEKPPTSPSAGSGANAPANPVQPCPKCNCCVVSAVIQNVRAIGATATRFRYGTVDAYAANGHAFDFVMTFNYTGGTSGTSDCTFEWWEKVDLPAHATHPAGTWTEMVSVGSPTSPLWIPWNNRAVPCPAGGTLSVTLTDPPGLGNAPGRTLTRNLEFRLVAKSGSGCPCAITSATARATQVLVMVNGVLDTAASSFTIGASSQTP